MKKNLFWSLLAILMVAAVSAGFIACGGDDEEEESSVEEGSSVVGTWVDAHEGLTLTFNAGGTGTWIIREGSNSYSGEATKTGSFTYTAENKSRGIVALQYKSSHSSSYSSSSSGNSADVFFYTIENKTMYLYEDGYGEDLEFTLVKQ